MSAILIAFVGKPSAGKSSFLNAVTDAAAKVGNYPFTTIEPNHGVAMYTTECPCKRFNKVDQCRPRYGKCVEGKRFIPVKMLDVAGLVPGASEGKGLGNKFLDDLRHADVLIHVVDVSGTTNEKGEATTGYDPINDIDWLRSEIHSWIFNNLEKKWGTIIRRHVATKSSLADTFQSQLSGYGANGSMINRFVSKLPMKEPIEEWDSVLLSKAVDTFLSERFPTIIALNKIDMPEADKNIARICRKYGETHLVYCSALTEIFLRKIAKQGFIRYTEGEDHYDTYEDELELYGENLPANMPKLKKLDDKTRGRLEKVQDLVLFRYGSTGVQETIRKAVDAIGMIPTYPVKQITNFGSGRSGGAFKDALLVRPGITVREFARMVHPELDKYYLYAETVGGIRVAEDDLISPQLNIISFKTAQSETS